MKQTNICRLSGDIIIQYPPVSNLAFVSKLVERVVESRLVSYLSAKELA